MGEDTDAHVPIGINGKTLHPSAAAVNGLTHPRRSRQFTLQRLPMGIGKLIPVQIHRDHFFWREPNSQRCCRAINARTDQGVEFELDRELLFRKPSHFADFMLVDTCPHGLQFQWKPAVQEQSDSPHASVIAAWHGGESFVGFPGSPVKCDFDPEWRIFVQIISDLLVDQDAVGEKRDQKPLLLGVGIDREKILARKNLPSGEEEPQNPHIREFVEQGKILFFG